ncbi:MAG: hypothetical protein JSV35_01895 [Candidatus Bathyarchaeota archaeon]|nr:MAG: hypothetical protein JSV35_01895 [Candidatus Bathyarchaeota archaeon]
MKDCPECGTSITFPLKTWTLSRKGSSRGPEIGFYECPSCLTRFRARVGNGKEVGIKTLTKKIKGIEAGLVNTLRNLREKLKTLETERANLLLEIGELKKMAEGKASALESEIGMLREEVTSLRQLLGVSELDDK